MRVVHCADVVPAHRPDGRVVMPLLDLPVHVPVEQTAILFVEHPANFTEGRHHHQKLHEIFYFLDAADYWVNGELIHLQAGDLLVLEPNDVHGAVPVPHKVRLIVYHVPKVAGDKVDAPASRPATP